MVKVVSECVTIIDTRQFHGFVGGSESGPCIYTIYQLNTFRCEAELLWSRVWGILRRQTRPLEEVDPVTLLK